MERRVENPMLESIQKGRYSNYALLEKKSSIMHFEEEESRTFFFYYIKAENYDSCTYTFSLNKVIHVPCKKHAITKNTTPLQPFPTIARHKGDWLAKIFNEIN